MVKRDRIKKLSRDLEMMGLTVNSVGASSLVVENGSNDLTVSYVEDSFTPPVVGGIDPSVSPFLGIGVASPGKIVIKSASNANGNISDVIDSNVAAVVLKVCGHLANDIELENSDASYRFLIRGHADLMNLGQ